MAFKNDNVTGKKLPAIVLLGVSALVTNSALSASSGDSQLLERISPVGTVCIEGEDCGGAVVTVAAAAANEPRSGKAVYDSACFACHATGAAGAPKMADVAAWEPRIAKGLDTVVANAINGINAMPPKGTCMTCSDDDIRNAVQYMVDASQ